MNPPQMNANDRKWFGLSVRRVRLAAPNHTLIDSHRCGEPYPTHCSGIGVDLSSLAQQNNSLECLG
jgi:hypothetical protein